MCVLIREHYFMCYGSKLAKCKFVSVNKSQTLWQNKKLNFQLTHDKIVQHLKSSQICVPAYLKNLISQTILATLNI